MNKPTIMRFLGTRAVIYFAIMLIGMCAFFAYTISRAQNDAVRQTVYIEAKRAERHIVRQEDGKPAVAQSIQDDLEYCKVAVVSKDGEIVSGTLPEGVNAAAKDLPKHKHYQSVKLDGKTYVISDRRIMRFSRDQAGSDQNRGGSDKDAESARAAKDKDPRGREPELRGCFVRAVLCKDDFKSIYTSIQVFFYGFVVLLVLISVLDGIWLYRKAARPVREMCDDVKKIAEDPDHTVRVKSDPYFYETEVMKDASNRLMDRNEMLISQQEEFNENVSHELKTPVAVIRSEVELLEDLHGGDLSDEAKEALAVIHKQSDRINAIIAELRYMAKMDRENFALNKEKMELSDIAESVCDDIEEVTLRGRKFVYHWEPAEARIDIALVMVAVRNLITNAVKYSREGSVIDLYTGTEGGMAFFRVADIGAGIPEADLSRVFEPYYQVESSRNDEGSGLGLTLTMKIAEKHGGTVTAESAPGEGAAFTLFLPIF